jgi:tetratricopeptide (TPR) repeat protein
MAASMENKCDVARREKDSVSVRKWWHRVRRSPERARNRNATVLGVVVATLMSFSSAAAFEQNPTPRTADTAIIEGVIRDTAGKPIADATVLLEEKGNSTTIEAKTNVDGTFLLSTSHGGTYTVVAEKSGWLHTVADSLVLSLGEKKHVDLALSPVGSLKFESSPSPPSATASPGAMEFNDEPNFTVAGVTDWSNLGLHGSAASSKTSESLAKETLALKPSETEIVPGGKPGKQYELALADRTKGDFAGAREEVRKALAIADDAEGHRLLGELDERLNDPLDAVREYEKAARMDPNEQNYFEWGTELLLHKAAEPAVEVFTRGSNAHPNSARMLTGLGVALYSNGSWEEAARRLCAASDLQPSDTAPYLFLGKIEKTTPAPLPCSEQKLARFAQEQPGNALANYYYAISLWKLEKRTEKPVDSKEVETLLERSIAIDRKLDEAYLQLGVVYFAQADFEQAIRNYKKAIEINPQLGEAHRQLGLAYQRTGEKVKAQEEFQAFEQAEKSEAAEIERQRRELRQFLIILKDPPAAAPPR